MKLIHSKSSVMWFRVSVHLSSDPPTTLMDDIPLTVVSKQRYLGLIFDDQSSCWEGMQVYAILLIPLKQESLRYQGRFVKNLAESLMLSHLLYSISVWGLPLSHCNLQRIQ